MYSIANREWNEIFNDDLLNAWQNERKELKKTSMLLSALQTELRNVQTNIEVDILSIRQQLKRKDILKERKNSQSPPNKEKKKSPSSINKENECVSKLAEALDTSEIKSNNYNEMESPDLFKNIIIQSSPESSFIDLSKSDEDATVDSSPTRSPTIKRRRKYFKRKKISSPFNFNSINESKNIDNASKITGVLTPTVPTKDLVKTNIFKTPAIKSENDLSVIDCTPEVIAKETITNRKSGAKMNWRKKKSKREKAMNTTLTQMFGRPKQSFQPTINKKTEPDVDSDETHCEDSEGKSKMGITDLLSYINKDETSRLVEASRMEDRIDDDQTTYCNLNSSSEEVDEFSKGAIFNESDVSTSIEKPKIVAPEPEPVVRGKARKQLQGWACEQCKNFYDDVKLPPEEIKKKMDECSRHRYKYQPPAETIPGFWDLSIPPEGS